MLEKRLLDGERLPTTRITMPPFQVLIILVGQRAPCLCAVIFRTIVICLSVVDKREDAIVRGIHVARAPVTIAAGVERLACITGTGSI